MTSGTFQARTNECQISERVGLLSIFIGRHRLTKSTRRSELELQHMVGGPASMKTFILDNLLRIICEQKQTRSTDDQWSIQIIFPYSFSQFNSQARSGYCMRLYVVEQYMLYCM